VTRTFTAALLALALALPGAVLARDHGTLIDLSVAADGSCQARIGDQSFAVTQESLNAKLPALLPNRKAPLHFAPSYEKVPYKCFGPVMSTLQRLGYDSVTLDAEPPPLGPEITNPLPPGQ
jgi:biopolymer transport protein ExbD